MGEDRYIGHRSRLWLYALLVTVLAFLAAPVFIIVPMSFSDSSMLQFPPETWSLRWYRAYFGSSAWMAATQVSLVAAFFTVLIATPLGVAAAYAVRVSGPRYGDAVVAILMTPLIVPGILVAVGIYFVYAKLNAINSMPGLVFAHTMHALPFVYLTVAAGLNTYDMSQEQVARSLGATRFGAFLTITLPQIKFSILAGAFLAFISSFDEVLIAMFISGGGQSTLPRRMFSELRSTIDPTIAAISSLLIAIAAVVYVVSHLLQKRDAR